MRAGLCRGDEIVELYFYDELDADARAEAAAHLVVCPACRESLADLRAIDTALASRDPDVLPSGGWNAVMGRLDARLDAGAAPAAPRARREISLLRIAAAITLVAAGAFGGWTLSRVAPADPPPAARPALDVAIADASDSGLARARVVLAGLAQKEDGAEWALERRMAATLLPEVSLIRQMADDRGRGEFADILLDVETLLLQASYAERDDPETLARLRGMIDRRDLLMRLSIAAGDPEAASPAPRTRRGI